MSDIRFLVCPQRTYEKIDRGEKKTIRNPMVNLEHIVEVIVMGETRLDNDKSGNFIDNSFKYRVYFYSLKGESSWYFNTQESMDEWVFKFEDAWGLCYLSK